MRFMMLMIPEVYQTQRSGKNIGPDFTPDPEEVAKMMKYNEELAQAVHLIALDGLTPPAKGARVSFSRGKATVTDGPFTEAKEVLGGYWMIDVRSKDEALAWAKRCPAQDGDVIEIRQVFEISDFPPETRKAADSPVIRTGLRKQRPRN